MILNFAGFDESLQPLEGIHKRVSNILIWKRLRLSFPYVHKAAEM